MAAVGVLVLEISCFVFSTMSALIFNSKEESGFFLGLTAMVRLGCQVQTKGRAMRVHDLGTSLRRVEVRVELRREGEGIWCARVLISYSLRMIERNAHELIRMRIIASVCAGPIIRTYKCRI